MEVHEDRVLMLVRARRPPSLDQHELPYGRLELEALRLDQSAHGHPASQRFAELVSKPFAGNHPSAEAAATAGSVISRRLDDELAVVSEELPEDSGDDLPILEPSVLGEDERGHRRQVPAQQASTIEKPECRL